MPMAIHNFSDSNKVGKEGERQVSEYLRSKGYKIIPATLQQQLTENWDIRIEKDGEVRLVEIKTEPKAEKTGNFFWEMTVDTEPGWTQNYKSNPLSISIVWFLPFSKVAYAINSKKLPVLEETIVATFPERTVHNTNYSATGFLVPVSFIASNAQVINIE
jgi:hypothetical protein